MKRTNAIRTAMKDYSCDKCGDIIKEGTRYYHKKNDSRIHLHCGGIREGTKPQGADATFFKPLRSAEGAVHRGKYAGDCSACGLMLMAADKTCPRCGV